MERCSLLVLENGLSWLVCYLVKCSGSLLISWNLRQFLRTIITVCCVIGFFIQPKLCWKLGNDKMIWQKKCQSFQLLLEAKLLQHLSNMEHSLNYLHEIFSLNAQVSALENLMSHGFQLGSGGISCSDVS